MIKEPSLYFNACHDYGRKGEGGRGEERRSELTLILHMCILV